MKIKFASLFLFLMLTQTALASYCGAGLTTYFRNNAASGDAVLCVRFVDRNSFAWYSQGTNFGNSFRLVGYSWRAGGGFSSTYASINGNGEHYSIYTNQAENFSVNEAYAWDEKNPPQRIFQTDTYPSIWVLSLGAEPSIVSLPLIRNCGQFLTTMRLQGTGNDSVRCILSSNDKEVAAWVGAGAWNGVQYQNLGTAFFSPFGPQYGASDICHPGFVCGSTRFGDIRIERITLGTQLRGYQVTGAWNEIWLK